MVGHEQKQIRPPQGLLLPITNAVKYLRGGNRQSQLVFETLPTVDGDEIDCLLRINPRRNRMWQAFAWRALHARMLQQRRHSRQGPGGVIELRRGQYEFLQMVGASRCDARTAQRAVPTSETKNFVLHRVAQSAVQIPSRGRGVALRRPDGAARRPYLGKLVCCHAPAARDYKIIGRLFRVSPSNCA